MIKRIVFATGNEGKMREVRQILQDLDCQILSMKEAGIQTEIIEDGSSFEENALIKAGTIAAELKKDREDTLVLADDSGLEIDYLHGEPGIYSARYLGEDTPYSVKNKNLIDRLEGVEDARRTARFVCAIAAVFPDGEQVVTKGTIEGIIGYEERGEGGFGYDPIFFLPQYQKTTAELTAEEKNRISHRGQALRKMKEELKDKLDR